MASQSLRLSVQAKAQVSRQLLEVLQRSRQVSRASVRGYRARAVRRAVEWVRARRG